MDLHVTGDRVVEEEIDEYINFFNEQRLGYSMNYLMPKQYRESVKLGNWGAKSFLCGIGEKYMTIYIFSGILQRFVL